MSTRDEIGDKVVVCAEVPLKLDPFLSFDRLPGIARSDESHSSGNAARISGESLLEVVQAYLGFYASGESHTARAKRYDLQHFLEFLARGNGGVETLKVSDWTLQSTKDFTEQRLASGEAPTTVARRLATLKHFGRTLAERVPGYINPAREVKSPVLRPPRPHGLSEEEILLLRRAAELEVEKSKERFAEVRNRCLLELLLSTGLRADEVRLLVMSQVSEDLSWLKNVKTKGKKYRNVYLDSQLRPLLEDYLLKRDIELSSRYPAMSEISPSQLRLFPVFVSHYNVNLNVPSSFGLSPKSIWRIISGFGRKAQALSTETLGRLHPHKLRHTFAHGLLDSSKDVRLVAQALGHSDIKTTMRYTERTDEEIASAIETKVFASSREAE